MILLSITGLFKMVLIIFGILFLLQIIGKIAQARRNIADQDQMQKEDATAKRRANESKENYGKTSISKIDKKSLSDADYTDFEEID